MRVALAALAAAATAALSGTAAAAPADGPAATATTPIRHVVLMMQTGHSFDNYFRDWPGADGARNVSCQVTSKRARCISPFAFTPRIAERPLRTTAALETVAVDRGRMDGFVRAQATRDTSGYMAMGYYRSRDMPVLTGLARHGVLFDHWFSGVPGGTIANRLFSATAQSPGDVGAVPARGWDLGPTIFDRLEAAGLPWRIYVQNYEPALTVETASKNQRLGGQLARVPVLATRRYLNDPKFMSHVVDLSQYYRDVRTGEAPAVSFVVSTTQSEQAPKPPDKGQRLARSVVNALIASPAWSSSAFLLQYDSGGGFYDHVTPPLLAGSRAGIRVPAILISPYAHAGAVDHHQHDAASALRFLEQNWRLPALSSRDAGAAGLADALHFRGSPAQGNLLPTTVRHPVPQPRRLPLYVGYVSALVVAALLLGWAARNQRVRRLVG